MKSRFWIVLCVLAVAGAWLLWPSGHRPSPAVKKSVAAAAPAVSVAALMPPPANALPKCLATVATNNISAKTNRFAFRLANTAKTIGQLASDRHAILLDNALIETDAKMNLKIPAHLRAAGDPGAFIVQARGVISAAFRAALAAAGGQIVSYIPNNAYLVQLDAAGAGALAGNPLVQAVLPYDPYYKVQSSLLGLAVNQEPLPDNTYLTLGLFSGNAAATAAQIQKLGGEIVGTDRSPFGPVLHVQPPANWIALAQLPGVQIVEPAHRRVSANDLSRQTLGVALTSVAQTNYLNLTGTNVLVEVNDTGIDTNQPDLTGRVFVDSAGSGFDPDGHGTFVAGQIAGSGAESLTVTNAEGSIMPPTNGQFRGMAPAATLFSVGGISGYNADEAILGRQGVGGQDDSSFTVGSTNFFLPGAAIHKLGATTDVFPFYVQYPDWYLQEAPAATNALISNNSWVNEGDNQYDLAAASYDAAVRDALPEVTGPQPVLFVFAAGNGGGGDDDGGGGNPDTISSPATAKNVITVGALEQYRDITNTYIPFGTTNPVEPWYGQTSSGTEVAGFSARGNVGIGTEGAYGRFKPDVVAPGTFVVSTRSTNWDTTTYYNPTNYYHQYYSSLFGGIGPDTVGASPAVNSYDLNEFGFTALSNVISITIQVLPEDPANVANMPVYVSVTNTTPDAGNSDFPPDNNNMASIPPDGGPNYLTSIFNNNGQFYFSVGNPTNVPVTYDVLVTLVTTNDMGNYFMVLSNLNDSLGPWYRYESGTSMAAADVSGVLALMQDYFTNTLHTVPSPALLKAMLINGARPTGYYNLQVNNTINYEGWGLVNLPNSIPATLTNVITTANNSVFFVDQNPTNTLATGDTRTYTISVPPASQALPLRITLAWTDPPGNPAAALKLVNNLSLIVTNLDNPTNPVVYFGNDIETDGFYNNAQNATNPAVLDNINNVQNVFLPQNSGTNFVIVVAGTAVNVNAVTTQTNDAAGNYAPNITQDYALVISCGNGSNTNGFAVTATGAASNPTGDQRITVVLSTNAPLMNQTVGASSPVMSTNTIPFPAGSPYVTNALLTIGQTNQWHFYVVTNTGADSTYTNAAFAVFLPDTLAIPRQGVFAGSDANSTLPEANIDLFVTTDSNLLTLSPMTISNCMSGAQVGATVGGVFYGSALARGGSKFIVDSNSTAGTTPEVYYVGVQSEDQMACEYDFLPEFSNIPFSQLNANGDETVTFFPVDIPDPVGNLPGYTNTLGLAIFPVKLQRVVVTNVVAMQNYGDVAVALSHGTAAAGSAAVDLASHFAPNTPGIYTNIYDDSVRNDIPGSQPSAGPGSLNQYIRQEGEGIWNLHAADDAPAFVGSISGSLFLEKYQDPTKGVVTVSVAANSWYYTYVTVPVGYTNLTVYGIDENYNSAYPLTLAVNFGSDPTLTNNDGSAQLTIPLIAPPGYSSNSVSIGPPLEPGTYYIGIYNPDSVAHTVEIGATLGLYTSSAVTILDYDSTGAVPLLDDAVNYAYMDVTNTDVIQGISVGLRVDHPRISDLVFTLVDPIGNRYLLMENRGGQSTNGCGANIITTNVFNASANGTAQPNTNVINTGSTSGTIPITYNFYTAPDQMTIYYGTNISTNSLIYDTGVTYNQPYPGGPGPSGTNTIPVSTNVPYAPPTGIAPSTYLTIIMDQFPTNFVGGTNRSDLWTYSAGTVATNFVYLAFTEDTNLTTTPIKFAPPPFVPQTNFTPVLTDSFEAYPVQSFAMGSTFGGWVVAANYVDIVTNPPAIDGVNSLQLDDGVIYTNVTTVPGQKYNLTYDQGNNLVATNAGWQPENFSFTATATNTELVLAASATASSGVTFADSMLTLTFGTNTLLDDLVLTELPANLYYQPEQDISGLVGERAYGTMASGNPWQLEILDNRAGATATNAPVLLSWQLEFTFANTNIISPSAVAPFVLTEPATNIMATAATLNALVYPGGVATTLYFEYGLTTNSWIDSPGLLLTNNLNSTNYLSIDVTNLVPGSVYYFQAITTNSAGTNYGGILTFTAAQDSAPLAFTEPASAITGVGAQLNGFIAANGNPTLAWFEYGTNTLYGQVTLPVAAGSSTNVFFVTSAVTNLTYGMPYHFRLVASNAVGVVRGFDHVFGVGSVVAWGQNNYGQTNVPAGLSNVVAVAGTDTASLALKADGTVVAWGGINGETNIPSGVTNIVSIAAAAANCMALRADGTVLAWGQSNPLTTGLPAVVSQLTNVVALAVGYQTGIALRNDGSVISWGQTPIALSATNGIAAVASGYNFLPSLTGNSEEAITVGGVEFKFIDSGSAYSINWTNVVALSGYSGYFGTNSYQAAHTLALRGDGTILDPPTYITYNNNLAPAGNNFEMVAAGGNHGLAQTVAGGVMVWGDNTFGQTNLPANLTNVVAIGAGAQHSLVVQLGANLAAANPAFASTLPATLAAGSGAQLNGFATPNGTAATAWFEWGASTNYGTLTTPVSVGSGSRVVLVTNQISGLTLGQTYHCRLVVSNAFGVVAGFDHLFGLDSVIAWGSNTSGQTNVPTGLTNAVAIAGGDIFSLALKNDGTVVAWGGNAGDTNIPAGLSNVAAIAAYDEDSVALRNDGTVVVWGGNNFGQTNVPAGLNNVVAIAASVNDILVLKSDGTVATWGDNTYGQTNVPAGLSNVVAVASGDFHNLALKNDGTVVAWGFNFSGQTNVPAGLSNVVAIAAEETDSLALKSDGTVVVWGDNSAGQTNVPAGLNSVVAIAGGAEFSLALQNIGTIVAWGHGANGETNVPATLTNALAVAAGAFQGLALAPPNINIALAAPYTATLPATAVTGLSAQLNGFATPNGLATAAWFEWGVDRTYGNQTAATNVGNGFNVVFMTNAISGLVSTLPYHYRLVVSNALGVAHGSDQLFGVGTPVAWGADSYTESDVPAGLTNMTAIAAGTGFSDALGTDGTVRVWGTNTAFGQIQPPAGLNNVAGISIGTYDTLALINDGTVAAWGTALTNLMPAGLSNVVMVSSGDDHGMVLKSDGTVVTWGNSLDTNVPAGLNNVVAIAAGGYHSLALKNDGTVVAWGNDSAGETDVPAGATNVVSVVAKQAYSMALRADGQLFVWGFGGNGETNIPATVTNVASMAIASAQSVALQVDGMVTVWGFNGSNQTNVPAGLTNALAVATATAHVLALEASTPATVATAYATTLPATAVTGLSAQLNGFATPNGQPSMAWFAWGTNAAYGNTTAPVSVGSGSNVVYVTQSISGLTLNVPYYFYLVVSNAVGVVHATRQVLGEGSLIAWGDNIYVPTNPPAGLSNVVAVAVNSFGLALKNDGTVVPWGDNTYGEQNVPAGLTNAVAVAAAFGSAMALKQDGTVIVWGWNNSGQTNVPAGLSNVVAISAGNSHEVALKSDGTVVAWGYDGDGETDVPPSLSNVVAIATGAYHTLALKNDGTVVAWGRSSSGQTNVPAGLNNVVMDAAGGYFSLALQATGNLVAWGSGPNGETNIPPGLTNVASVAAGLTQSVVLNDDGTVASWGMVGLTNVPAGLSNVVAVASGENISVALVSLQPVPTVPLASTSPPLVVPNISGVSKSANGLKLQWSVSGSGTFQVQWKTNLAAAWNTITNPTTTTTNGVATFTDNGSQSAPLGSMRFYRLVWVP
jgi:alpha-tubulin suppressor-like RCC1 family protein/subtilisin-like proprotein convertase family protein